MSSLARQRKKRNKTSGVLDSVLIGLHTLIFIIFLLSSDCFHLLFISSVSIHVHSELTYPRVGLITETSVNIIFAECVNHATVISCVELFATQVHHSEKCFFFFFFTD